MKSKNIILDTNLWISFLISKQLDFIDNLIIEERIKLLFSNELIEEFLTVTQRAKFRKYFSDESISSLLNLFESYGELIDVTSNLQICRDHKDNFLLNLAIDGKADFLITGDADLLEIKKIKKTKIITWADFIHNLK